MYFVEVGASLKSVVFVEGESLYSDGDVDGAINAWLKFLQNIPGMFLYFVSNSVSKYSMCQTKSVRAD